MSISAPPGLGPRYPTLLRAERWRPREGAHHALLRIGYDEDCTCILLARDPVSRTWTLRKALFSPEAIELDRSCIVSAMANQPSDPDDIDRLGYLSGNPEPLLSLVSRIHVDLRPLVHHGNYVWHSPASRRHYRKSVRYGYPHPRGGPISFLFEILPRGRVSKPRETHVCRLDAIPYPGGPVSARRPVPGKGDGSWEEAKGFIQNWVWQARRRLMHTWTPFLNGSHWTNEVHAFYSHPGSIGRNRRQAGALYPNLAPLIASTPEVSALVDAGRPYEDAVCGVLDTWICPEGSKPTFTRAKLRLMRHRKPTQDPMPLLELAADLPHDRLRNILDKAGPLRNPVAVGLRPWAREWGLDLVRLTDDVPPMEPVDLKQTLGEARDMIGRCADTLVAPHFDPVVADTAAMAALLLFGDRSFRAVQTLVTRWHRRMEAFEVSLPEGKDLVTWPALFEPFVHARERIVCLTRQSQLRDEGRGMRDRSGMQGLSHCIGGYGRSCYAGTSFVASVRSDRTGEWRRLSTVEFVVRDGGLVERQHQGPGNSKPVPEALAAVAALAASVKAGEVALSGEARTGRDEAGFRDGIDYRAPGIGERVLAAWSPYLPGHLRNIPLQDFRAWLRDAEASGRPARRMRRNA